MESIDCTQLHVMNDDRNSPNSRFSMHVYIAKYIRFCMVVFIFFVHATSLNISIYMIVLRVNQIE